MKYICFAMKQCVIFVTVERHSKRTTAETTAHFANNRTARDRGNWRNNMSTYTYETTIKGNHVVIYTSNTFAYRKLDVVASRKIQVESQLTDKFELLTQNDFAYMYNLKGDERRTAICEFVKACFASIKEDEASQLTFDEVVEITEQFY